MRPLAILLSILLMAAPLSCRAAAAGEYRAALLIEATTGCVLDGVDTDVRLPVGTLAKLMTAYLTAQHLESGDITPETVLTAGEGVREVKGAVIWLEPGDRITVEELLLGLLAGNANDAAVVLADRISGSSAAFVMDMNAAAFDLGMRNTRFTSPQGYDDPAAYSTAADMGLLACAVLRSEVLTPYLSVWRTFIREESVELVNENTLTRTMEHCRGLKAAHSEQAGYCLAAAAERDGMVCAAIVLGCEDEDARFSVAKRLLNRGFSGYHLTTPGFSEEFLRPLAVRGGMATAVELKLSGLPLLAVGASAQPGSVTVLPDYCTAPIRAGQQLGTVYFYEGDTLLCEAQLQAAEDVPVLTHRRAWGLMLDYLFS